MATLTGEVVSAQTLFLGGVRCATGGAQAAADAGGVRRVGGQTMEPGVATGAGPPSAALPLAFPRHRGANCTPPRRCFVEVRRRTSPISMA